MAFGGIDFSEKTKAQPDFYLNFHNDNHKHSFSEAFVHCNICNYEGKFYKLVANLISLHYFQAQFSFYINTISL